MHILISPKVRILWAVMMSSTMSLISLFFNNGKDLEEIKFGKFYFLKESIQT